jgi:hypothetical protein
MSKSSSGLFSGTTGYMHALGEDVFEKIMPNGEKNVDFNKLPGSTGYQIKNRLTDKQMEYLTNEYGVEFAQVYRLGPGKNGGGGTYYIYSGTRNSVLVPVDKNTILINHTHPGGTASPSKQDMKLMAMYAKLGSPQKTSAIIPSGKATIKFTSKGKKR